MKKLLQSRLFFFILGAVIFSGITGVVAATLISSDDVTYNDKTAKEALDELYTRLGTMKTITEYNNAVNSSQIGRVELEDHPRHGAWVRCTIYNKAGQKIYETYE